MNAVSFQNGAQWVTLSSFIGLILPVLIEKFAGGIKGKSKIVVVGYLLSLNKYSPSRASR